MLSNRLKKNCEVLKLSELVRQITEYDKKRELEIKNQKAG